MVRRSVVLAVAFSAVVALFASPASAHKVRVVSFTMSVKGLQDIVTKQVTIAVSWKAVCSGARTYEIQLGVGNDSLGVAWSQKVRTATGTVPITRKLPAGTYRYGATVRCVDPASGGPGHPTKAVSGPHPDHIGFSARWANLDGEIAAWKFTIEATRPRP